MPRPLVKPAVPSAERKIACTCGRSFKTGSDLQQHQHGSPLHSNTAKADSAEFEAAAETQTRTTVGRIPTGSRGGRGWTVADGLLEKEIFPEQQYANFRSEETFPTFTGLPEENDINLAFYDTVDGFSYMPRKHWCFLAEIIDIEQFIRVKLIVQDKAGTMVPVAFHTDGRGTEFAELQPGSTVAILYAHQHGFLDLTAGIRQEEYCGVKVDLSNLHYPKDLGILKYFSDHLRNAG
ncbi:hypothetical protein QBC36DRAFT_179262 [Triangularia setosa]|uniref:Uncharacterized protein n=1 Tax=Triangularia setosa TaxID=2587417 RepID=A0AAN6WDF9_9PEZI|nr:hypothetical protein QBC36DRAFT_179262 [Podospora setosa]